jgi:hypothetical protein
MPDVDNVIYHIPPKHMNDTEHYPFVEYGWKRDGGSFLVSKGYVRNRVVYSFVTVMSGFANNPHRPIVKEASDIEKKWNSECGAEATTLFL